MATFDGQAITKDSQVHTLKRHVGTEEAMCNSLTTHIDKNEQIKHYSIRHT